MASISPTTLSNGTEPYTGKKAYIKLHITEITQSNGATNKTYIKWKLTVEGTPWTTLYRAYATLGGKVLYDAKPELTNWSAGQQFASGSVEFDNAGDGSLTLYAYVKQQFYYGNGDTSRWTNSYYYQEAGVNMVCSQIPRYAAFTSHYVAGIDENNVAIAWGSDVNCDAVQYSLNGGAWTGTSGAIYYVGGLAANTAYNIRTRIKRTDSQLWTESSYLYFSTYNYPHCTEIPNFTIGNNATAKFYNPLNRTFEIQLWSVRGGQFVSDRITVTGDSYTGFANLADRLYASIPNNWDSSYNIDTHYGGNKHVKGGGTYSIRGNEIPTFNESNIINVVDTLHVNDITGLATKIIKGHNRITGSITRMTPNYYSNGSRYVISANASPSSQELSYDNGATKSFSFDNITANSFTVTAYDTRNLPNAKTKYIDLVDYWNPKVNNFTITRQNGLGDYAILAADGAFAHWHGWSEIKKYNSIQKVYFRYKASTANNYSNWIDITNSLNRNSEGSWSLNATLDIVFTNTVKYDFQLFVQDLLESSSVASNSLSTANGFLWRDLKNKRLGINKKPDHTLDVGGEANMDALYINGIKVLWEE